MSSKHLIFSPHAEAMLHERGIERLWVERTLAEPIAREPDPKPGRMRAFRPIAERGGRVLRVVYVDTDQGFRILTVFFDRRRRR